MNRERLERRQVWVYLVAISGGLALGLASPALGAVLEPLLWPVLGVLLFSTFTLIPLDRLPAAFGNRRFLVALFIGNFLAVPALVWLLIRLLPDDPAIRLGVAAVLLLPCTDWFTTFTHLGRGNAVLAIAVSPLLLLVQLVALPLYLVLFFDGMILARGIDPVQIAIAFGVIVLVPLVLAYALERRAQASLWWRDRAAGIGWLPVPLLAVVVFIISASQVQVVSKWLPQLGLVVFVFIAYLVIAGVLGRLVSGTVRLDTGAARTLVFSLGTRNSFVVLPLALALPAGWEAVAVVIVVQTLVELLGMLLYLIWVPRRLLPDADECPGVRA
ncbi:MAG: arsenic resistance protein [Burkholderiales bacterium]